MSNSTLRNIKKYGKSLTFNRVTYPESPAPGDVVVPTETPIVGLGVFGKYKTEDIDGTTILRSDRRVLWIGDEIKNGDKYGDYTVNSVIPFSPKDDTPEFYDIQLRV